MIDGLFKRRIDPLWEKLARPLARHATANQITLLGLGLTFVLCLIYLLWQSDLFLGLSLAFAFAADSLDGAVARLRQEQSRFGGYFDAMADRYQELVVYAALAYVHDLWIAAFFVLSGTYLTSYAKARTAIEQPVNNTDWPDLFERQERVIFICAMLILTGLLSAYAWSPMIITAGLWLLAGLTHATALQRFARARRLLKKAQPLKN